jgi:ABC-type transporter Mla subunit MlaD
MTLREILSGTSNWFRSHRYEPAGHCDAGLDSDGLLTMALDAQEGDEDGASLRVGRVCAPRRGKTPSSHGTFDGPNTVTSLDRRDSVEKLQEGFNRLIDQLQQINEHLNDQVSQHHELMGRVKQLPRLLESLPSAVENQKMLTTQLLDQLRSTAAKDQQFLDVVGRIPVETSRQTDTLTSIDHQLAAAADADVQMASSFQKFRDTLDRLNNNTVSNTEGILQMSKTFAASDRYLKYVVNRLNKRYAWVFGIAVCVCAAAICTLAGIVIYLAR